MATILDGPHLPITEDNHSGLIVIVTATAVAWTLTVLTIRIASVISVRTLFGLEEATVTISSILSVACSSAIFAAVGYGLGQRGTLVGPKHLDSVSKAVYSADLLYILALWISKEAMILLIRRLTPARQHHIACYIIGGIVSIWALASFFTVAIRCDTLAPWLSRNTDQCSNLFNRWLGIEIVGLLIEGLILALATYIIFNLQMPLKTKFRALIAFMTRLPLIAPAILRLIFLRSGLDASDFTFGMTKATIATQAALHYTVMAASFAYLKPFLSIFDSNMGATIKLDTVVSTSHQLPFNNQGNYSLAPVSRTVVHTQHRPSGEGRNNARSSSSDSNAPIILKTQTYEVRSEQMLSED